jgi:hypothetical protein
MAMVVVLNDCSLVLFHEREIFYDGKFTWNLDPVVNVVDPL